MTTQFDWLARFHGKGHNASYSVLPDPSLGLGLASETNRKLLTGQCYKQAFIVKKVLIIKSVGMTLAKVKEQDGMMLAKVKGQDWMTLAKVKELDGMMLAKVKYVKVPSIPASAACCDGV